MRRVIGLAILLPVLALPAWSQDKPAEDEKLYGTWVTGSALLLAPPLDALLLEFSKGGTTTIKQLNLVDRYGGYTTAPAKGRDFRLLDLFEMKGGKPVESTRVKAIYRIEGDTLTLAYSDKGTARPASLDPKAAKVLIYNRPKP
jgi:uncharacterized protein (TIGR03067 family)